MEDIFAQKEVIHFFDRSSKVKKLIRSFFRCGSQAAGIVSLLVDGRRRVQELDREDAGEAHVFLSGHPSAAAVCLRVPHRQEAKSLRSAASLE